MAVLAQKEEAAMAAMKVWREMMILGLNMRSFAFKT